MRIAIIGSGISGLVVAQQLHQQHDITLFEANDYVGGHTHTVDVHHANREYAVDTGFIVFNDRTYPNFIRLLDEFGVAYQATSMSFSVSAQHSGIEYCGSSLNSLFAQRRNIISPQFYKMLAAILRFNRQAPSLLMSADLELTLGDYLHNSGYTRTMIEHYIIPMGAAIWSTDPQRMLEFPAVQFVQFFQNHGLLSLYNRPQWYVIRGGSKSYINKLTTPFQHTIRLNTPVTGIQRHQQYVLVTTADGESHKFDAIFIATHSDQALQLLQDPSSQEQSILGSIAYQTNEVILHTDVTLLPKRRRAWAAWNYLLPEDKTHKVSVTYNMNILQNISAPCQFCVTLNNRHNIDPQQIIRTLYYQHPIFDAAAITAQQRWSEINGNNKTYYCGAYWKYGFHEDGVNSALRAVQRFNES